MKNTGKEAAEYLDRWQKILRLQDWTIRIVEVSRNWRKSGDIKIDHDNRNAALMINQKVESQYIEEIVVHELLHLKLWGMDQMIEDLLLSLYGPDESDPKKVFAYGQFMEVLEVTTQDLTKALISATGDKREMLFARVERQVKEELCES